MTSPTDPAHAADETRSLLAEAAGATPDPDLRRRLLAHLDVLGPGPDLPAMRFVDGTTG